MSDVRNLNDIYFFYFIDRSSLMCQTPCWSVNINININIKTQILQMEENLQ